MKYEWISAEKYTAFLNKTCAMIATLGPINIDLNGGQWSMPCCEWPEYVREVKAEPKLIELPVRRGHHGVYGFDFGHDSWSLQAAPSFQEFRGYKWSDGRTRWHLDTQDRNDSGAVCVREMPVAVMWQAQP